MSSQLWLVRHGQTEWSATGRHTSRTDLDLTEVGQQQALAAAALLAAAPPFAAVWTSPRLRARRTAEICGHPEATVDPDLVEWDYGRYEGMTSDEIGEQVPGWTIWTGESPDGETSAQVRERCERVVERARAIDGPVLVFGHGHALRSLAVTWLGLPITDGARFVLETATLSRLGWDHGSPAMLGWNEGSVP